MTQPELIDDPAALRALCDRLLSEPTVAVDTEFFWEKTYYPVLGLVQTAAADGSCWLIDPVALGDIRPFGRVLASGAVVKILHDAHQDLTILARATGASPRSVFDTKKAAGFAGLSSACSLKALLEELLGIRLEKTETRSDWIARPLSDRQIAYAADDVVYLPKVREELTARCRSDEVRGWMAEEFAAFDEPSLYCERAPEEAYLRIKGVGRLAPRQRSALRALAAWRERAARAKDRPRAYVAQDYSLFDAVCSPPRDAAAFRAMRGVPRRLPGPAAEAALEAIRRGYAEADAEADEAESRPRPPELDRKALKEAEDKKLAEIAAACEGFGLDHALVASRKDVEAWLLAAPAARENDPRFSGWRKRFWDAAE